MAAHQAPPSLGFSRQEHWSGLPFPSPVHESEKWKWSLSVMSNSSLPHGLQPTRPLHPWDFPGKSTGVGCHCLFWLMMLSNLNLCHPLFLLPSTFPSFSLSNELALASGGQSIGASASVLQWIVRVDYFRIDWSDLFAVQVTLKSLLQHHSSKASILWCSAFFVVQHSHPYMTTGKTIDSTRQTFVCKVMSLLFNVLSRFVTAFLPRSKCLLISWLQSLSAVILEPKKRKSVTASTFSLFAVKW